MFTDFMQLNYVILKVLGWANLGLEIRIRKKEVRSGYENRGLCAT